jgi:hypothetical protein
METKEWSREEEGKMEVREERSRERKKEIPVFSVDCLEMRSPYYP